MRLLYIIACILFSSCTPQSSTDTAVLETHKRSEPAAATDMIPTDTRMVGQWVMTHDGGVERNREQTFEIWAKDRRFNYPEYRLRVGTGVFDIKISGDDVTFTRIIYATAAGMKIQSVEIDYQYSGTYRDGVIFGTYDFLRERVESEKEDRVLPQLDQELFETNVMWHARKISNKNSWE